MSWVRALTYLLNCPLPPKHQTKCEALGKPKWESPTFRSLWSREIYRHCFPVEPGYQMFMPGREYVWKKGTNDGWSHLAGWWLSPNRQFAMKASRQIWDLYSWQYGYSFKWKNTHKHTCKKPTPPQKKLLVLCLFTDIDSYQKCYL